jgi:hypothetical protein
MSDLQLRYFRRLFAALNLAHRAQGNVLAEWLELADEIPGPDQREGEQGHEQAGEDKRAPETENASHEDEEDDYAPYKADKGNRPRLSLRLVWLVEDYRRVSGDDRQDRDEGIPKSSLYLYTRYATPKYMAPKMRIKGCTTLYKSVTTKTKIACG